VALSSVLADGRFNVTGGGGVSLYVCH
jgi:hypothetical protein